MEQHQGFFQELKQIYNIKIPIPEPSVFQQKHAKKFLFYIDLTNTQKYYDLMSKLSINNSQERQWQGGQLCEFEFKNDKQEQQSIFCYYFDNFIENDEIKIQSLFRFRIFLDNFIKTQENYQIKFVFHFVLKKNQNYLEFEQHLIKYSYLILDGSFYKDQDFICVYDKWDKDEMNCCKVSSKEIHHNKNKLQDRFDLSYIKLLDEAFVYAQYKQIVQNSIGYKCQEYLQSQVDVVLKEFEKELEKLQNDIELMIEFPVNLANEKESNQNVSQYLQSLKTFINEVFMLVKVDVNFDKMVEGLLKALKNERSKMLECLNKIVKEISQFENYLIISQLDKSPNEVFNQLLQFQFKLDESDIKVLQQIKQYQYNYGVITKTMLTIQINFYQWFEYFDLFLPQSFAYFQRINNKKYNINLKKPYVIVLGMTKVGKSTLLNILNKPENIRITKDNKFDVEKRNSKIILSHKNTSQTFQTQEVDIGEFIFVDTPGLRDTNGVNIVFNKLNIFNTINQVREQIFLFLIDGAQLSTSKNDLIDSINQINLMLTDQYLENNIIPMFTKVKDDDNMKQIITTWQTETMKDITDQKQLKILNIIKKALDQENYIKIYQANHYEIHEEIKLLEQEIKDLKDKICELAEEGIECRDQSEQLKQKKKELQDLNKQSLLSKKITQIKEDVLGKCKIILERKKNALQGKSDLNQKNELKLTKEENQLLYKILEHRDKFYKHLLNNITNEFIAQMLFDNSMSINDKVSLLYKIDNVNLERIQDIPEELMSQKTQDQIYKLDRFNNNIKKLDKNKDPTKVDFKEFKKKFTFICAAFTNEASIHHELQEFLTYKWKQIDQFYKIPLSIPNILITIPCALIMVVSAGSELFKKSFFVQKMEKEKQEKLIQAQIQQKYFKEFEKKNR